jgi:hypothetical protein
MNTYVAVISPRVCRSLDEGISFELRVFVKSRHRARVLINTYFPFPQFVLTYLFREPKSISQKLGAKS